MNAQQFLPSFFNRMEKGSSTTDRQSTIPKIGIVPSRIVSHKNRCIDAFTGDNYNAIFHATYRDMYIVNSGVKKLQQKKGGAKIRKETEEAINGGSESGVFGV